MKGIDFLGEEDRAHPWVEEPTGGTCQGSNFIVKNIDEDGNKATKKTGAKLFEVNMDRN